MNRYQMNRILDVALKMLKEKLLLKDKRNKRRKERTILKAEKESKMNGFEGKFQIILDMGVEVGYTAYKDDNSNDEVEITSLEAIVTINGEEIKVPLPGSVIDCLLSENDEYIEENAIKDAYEKAENLLIDNLDITI